MCFCRKKKNKNTNNDDKYIISLEEVVDHPFIMDFALGEDLVNIASNYLKTVPILYAVQLWRGKPNVIRAGSPCFHLDGLDTSCLRVLMRCKDFYVKKTIFKLVMKTTSFYG